MRLTFLEDERIPSSLLDDAEADFTHYCSFRIRISCHFFIVQSACMSNEMTPLFPRCSLLKNEYIDFCVNEYTVQSQKDYMVS